MLLPMLFTLFTAPPATLAPADSFRYRIVSTAVQEVDASALGQPSQTVTITTTALITLRLTDSAGGQVAHITVDSAGMDGGEAMAMLGPEMTDVPPGVFFHFFVKDGKPASDMTPSATSVPVLSLAAAIATLFTVPKPSAKVGDIWTDTTVVDTAVAQGNSKVTTISKWKVSSMEAGGRVLDADQTGVMEIETPVGKMSGTTSGKQHLVTRARGPLVRMNSDTITDMVMMMGTTQLTVKGTAKITIDPIP
ncbi:MAG: hypothetical protein IPP98_11730 [Gemmatimonadetes bacterium]|nr:hypothetical protein [Gemmatimonadota bacterium]